MTSVIAIDAGTTGVRALAVDESGAVIDVAYRELTQYFPRPGWVEHDALEIWDAVRTTVAEVAGRRRDEGRSIAAIGITNQRETVVAWDRVTGLPLARAVVWQDRRTAGHCEALRDAGHLDVVRRRTGLVLDPYFSATKMAWLLREGGVEDRPELVLGTVDTWVAWNLTGAAAGGVVSTDPTNASRTLLYDIVERRWSEELTELFGVPRRALAEVRPSCGRIGVVAGELAQTSGLGGTAVSGVAGDQQAALFGQACFSAAMTKVTYGTGSFVLMNVGEHCPEPVDGLLTTVAWDLGSHGGPSPVAYALEGAVFATGAAIQWLRDGLGIIAEAAEIGPLAATITDTEGVVVVPAFAGLGSPWWDPHARGTIVGLSRGTGAAHVARAVVEAIAFQVRDVIDAMTAASRSAPSVIRADGGAAAMDLLLELQADQLRVPVTRPASTETTAVGAATLAGLAEGVWGSLDELAAGWTASLECAPRRSLVAADAAYARWRLAVERSLAWAQPDDGSAP